MPAPRDPALDVRHWELAEKLRSTPPRPSDALRARVIELATEPRPAPRPPFRFGRLALAFAPVALVAVVIWSAGANLGSSGGDGETAAGVETLGRAPAEEAPPGVDYSTAQEGADREALRAADAARGRGAFSAPPSTGRLQRYHADLRIRVDDVGELGGATQRAMRTARALGGYVVSADYGAAREGESALVVRVPVGRVQEAIARFSDLGVLVSQRIRIQDLQTGFDRQERRIRSQRRTIARLEERLADRSLTPEQRATVRAELETARQRLEALLRSRDATLREGRLARLSLTLTTRGAAAVPDRPGYFERTMRDALAVTGKVLTWMLVVAVVASPFLALLLLAWLGERARRRRADDRLLERAA